MGCFSLGALTIFPFSLLHKPASSVHVEGDTADLVAEVLRGGLAPIFPSPTALRRHGRVRYEKTGEAKTVASYN